MLRKDFTVSALDVCDARTMGADAVLLIVAALTDAELGSFLALAGRLGLTALVEVHDDPELDRALRPAPTLIGVNQRDLHTFEVDHELALDLAEAFPAGVVAVAESGIRGADDAARLAEAGYQAVLVGETLVRSDDRRRRGGRPARIRAHEPARRRTARRRRVDDAVRQDLRHHHRGRRAAGRGHGGAAVGFVFAPSPRQMAPIGGGRHREAPSPRDGDRRGVPGRGAASGSSRSPTRSGCGPSSSTGSSRSRTPGGSAERAGWTIKAFPAGHRNIERFEEYGAELLLIDGASPGSGELFDWRLAEGVIDPGRLIVSGGLRPENVGAAIAHLHPWGVDVSQRGRGLARA